MGVVTPANLYQILLAATTYAESADPAGEINNYIIANRLLTPNIRTDTGQPDAWRDYQQILSELGLIFSTKILRRITPTPLGLAFLDGSFRFSEVITMQAFRFQYPNGHHTPISPSLRRAQTVTQAAGVTNFAALQDISGVRLRPAVLMWRVLRGLGVRRLGARNSIRMTLNAISCAVARSMTLKQCPSCVKRKARQGRATLPPLEGLGPRRNAQDWLKFLALTPIFDFGSTPAALRLSRFALDHRGEIDALCLAFEHAESFWQPGSLDRADKLGWYSYFGGVDLSVPPMPLPENGNLRKMRSRSPKKNPVKELSPMKPGDDHSPSS